jgi:hypothetical protein
VYGNYSDWKLFCILRRYLEPRKRHLSLKDASILIYKILMPVAPGSSIQYPVKAFGCLECSRANPLLTRFPRSPRPTFRSISPIYWTWINRWAWGR